MTTEGNSLSAAWLKPIFNLTLMGDFDESYALAEYFPQTFTRQLLQLAALLGANKILEADALFGKLDSATQIPVADFTNLLDRIGVDLPKILSQALGKKLLRLARYSLELHLAIHPEAAGALTDAMIRLASQALSAGDVDLGVEWLQRAKSLDSSPDNLVLYAEVALTSRRPESSQALLALARNLINEAVYQLPKEDITNRWKAAKLLAIDQETFPTACGVLRDLVKQEPSLIKKAYSVLLSLVGYKPYFGDVVDFLLEMDATNFDLIIEKLVEEYKKSKSLPFLEKAQSVLSTVDMLGGDYSSKLASASVVVGRLSGNLESYAKRLQDTPIKPALSLAVAQALIAEKTTEYSLVSRFLEQALGQKDNHGDKALVAYIDLSRLASSRGEVELFEEFLAKAVALSTNLDQFLLATSSSSADALELLSRAEPMLRDAPWYADNQVVLVVRSIIKKATSSERRRTLYRFIDRPAQIRRTRLMLYLRALFGANLGLTRYDVERIKLKMSSLPKELQDIIQTGLSKQEISNAVEDKYERGWGFGAMAMARSDVGSSLRFSRLWLEEGFSSSAGAADSPSWQRPRTRTSKESTLKVERHTRIEFPSECTLGREAELKIQLTKGIPKLTRVLEKVAIQVEGGAKHVVMDVHVTAPTFAIPQCHRRMTLPVDDDSEEVVFTLTPSEVGEQAIEIEFFYNSSRVGYVIVKTSVRHSPSPAERPNMVFMESPGPGLVNATRARTSPDRRILHVSWIEREAELQYTIYSADASEFPEWRQSGPKIQDEITTYLRNLNAFLTEVVTLGSPTEEEWDSICLNLQGVGEHLFNAVMPPSLAKVTRDWTQGSTLIISTNEQWIPWEMMFDGQDFWGNRFLIARYPRLTDRRDAPNTDRPDGFRIRPIKAVVNVVGGGVPTGDARRAAQLFNDLSAFVPVAIIKEKPVSVLEKALRGTDIFHCTCHGLLEPHLLRVAKDKSRIKNLLLETVQKLPLEPGSLVFVNACASTVPLLTFGKFSSFGWEFYRRGAQTFVGTLGAVPVKYAITFAEDVYLELLRKKRKVTIGQAVAAARRAAATQGNFFWLLYCIYGDPDLSIGIPKPSKEVT